jgi:hypothetical protein
MLPVDLYVVALVTLTDSTYQQIQKLTLNGNEVLLHEHAEVATCEGQPHWRYYKYRAKASRGLPGGLL